MNDLSNLRILVTGGCGFIGSHICEHLVRHKCKLVRIVDNLSIGSLDNIRDILNKQGDDTKVEFILGDVTKSDICKKACVGIDIICHQAAVTSVPKSFYDPLFSHNTNVNGTLNLLLSAKDAGIKRFIYASSSAVYGDDIHTPKVETTIGNQISPYGLTKYMCELYGNIFTSCYDMECIGLRYFNVFGPRQNPNGAYASVIPVFINSLLSNESPKIYGDGTYSRDFTYVDNIVNANLNAMTKPVIIPGVYNVGSGESISINKLYFTIAHYLESTLRPNYKNIRKGDIAHSNSNITKSRLCLDYGVNVDFMSGLKRTISWYKKNRNYFGCRYQ